ncbi:MAG: ABC transporter ATP-binding protein [Pseudanabaena sp.]|jgi:ABC-2 type transport system ATP-binding protein|nr:ABC transporter ATP-binding protein [Pseudanabaena sp. M53BS1SP1A06MG]MCA6583384.1 ABC transporter ATP-binding protein [Pseudanabaena sp. M34BS1SP1A06MG]MCA6586043.1 ABC transporter ATP-binding protein [Pseudanabaena sp. M051S1SP1A06QC]MCA6587915.1 ABC transporter ATP-binding protein [Pseudanabaena sp. M109S1SP1A06QC]MCA6592369.1 ABC transporter ATP-binding protein [Pseudanabaena sp. M38BS1SP1A06MG]MCA6594887.1 ABC transporter ATP-binding protein [Pseudanabaena sp. M046S1SP1A06QC]MCA660248
MTSVPTVRTHRLTKQFDNHIAVNHINLQIDRGDVYGLIGPNGAGKTTLIRMLAAAEEPTAGEIYINGARFLRGQNNPELKRQLGYLPDDFPLYDDLTVWDYLDYFARLYFLRDPQRTQRLHEVIELVELQQKRNEAIATLSRGMKQRLSLARSIIHNPTLLLLDEPVSGLDPLARVQVRNIIKSLQQQGMTILISSHILSDLAEICTSIGIMELGRLVESSRLQELYDRSNQDRQQLLISTLGNLEDLQAVLKRSPLVQEVEVISGVPSVRVQFGGSIEECAILLKSLIDSGIPISNFHRTQETLENIFLKLGYKQTS